MISSCQTERMAPGSQDSQQHLTPAIALALSRTPTVKKMAGLRQSVNLRIVLIARIDKYALASGDSRSVSAVDPHVVVSYAIA